MSFHPNICTPKGSKLHNSKPTCSSRLCHFSSSQLKWSFLLYCLLLKPRAWLTGCRPTRPDDLDSLTANRETQQAQDINVIFCLRVELHISKGKDIMEAHASQELTVVLVSCVDLHGAVNHSKLYTGQTDQWEKNTRTTTCNQPLLNHVHWYNTNENKYYKHLFIGQHVTA